MPAGGHTPPNTRDLAHPQPQTDKIKTSDPEPRRKRGRARLKSFNYLLWRELHGDDCGVGYQRPPGMDWGKMVARRRCGYRTVFLGQQAEALKGFVLRPTQTIQAKSTSANSSPLRPRAPQSTSPPSPSPLHSRHGISSGTTVSRFCTGPARLSRPAGSRGTCFMGLNVLNGYPGELYGWGVCVPVCFSDECWFYEPFGWPEGRKVEKKPYWSIARETRGGETLVIGGRTFVPRVSLLNLKLFIFEFLKGRPQFGANRRPVIKKVYANIMDRRGFRKANATSNREFANTIIAVGAVEHVTDTYTFFVLNVNPTTQKIELIVASMLQSSDLGHTFSVESLVATGDMALYREAMIRTFGRARGGDVRHVCEKWCGTVKGSGGVELLKSFSSVERSVERVYLDEWGMVLRGWM
ncbi:hypothetical protein DFH27DRAFT_29238 [Peziza echinospora]|nr:hypothetical protein DFH27DRAFT_29238 [Peziza echinospora]